MSEDIWEKLDEVARQSHPPLERQRYAGWKPGDSVLVDIPLHQIRYGPGFDLLRKYGVDDESR